MSGIVFELSFVIYIFCTQYSNYSTKQRQSYQPCKWIPFVLWDPDAEFPVQQEMQLYFFQI